MHGAWSQSGLLEHAANVASRPRHCSHTMSVSNLVIMSNLHNRHMGIFCTGKVVYDAISYPRTIRHTSLLRPPG
eukprot:2706675-Amphidinium_carterae.1